MYSKIILEECWAIPENFKAYNPSTLASKGVIRGNLIANLLDIHGHRLQQMDKNGVNMMILSLSSPGVQGVTDPAGAASLARLVNDWLEAEVLKNPSQFAAFVALSMHDPKEVANKLCQCMFEKKGFVEAMLNDFQSAGEDGNTMLFFDQSKYNTFWAVAAELDAPIYIHP